MATESASPLDLSADALKQEYEASAADLKAGYAAPATSAAPQYRPWVKAAGQALGPLGTAIGQVDEAISSRVPNIPSAPLGLAMPGGAAMGPLRGIASNLIGKYGPGLLAQSGMQGGAAGAEALMEGKGLGDAAKSAGLSAVGTGVLGKAVQGVQKVASGTRLPGFASDVSGQLLDKLKQVSPSFAGAKKLTDIYEPAYFNAAHQAYEKSLGEVVKKGAGKMVGIPAEAAQALGLAAARGGDDAAQIAKMLGARPGQKLNLPGVATGKPAQEGMQSVDAGQLAQAMTGKSGTAAYRAAAGALDDANIGDPAARGAYRAYMGLRGYLDKQGAMKTGKLDIMKAQEGLHGKNADILLRRQLGDFIDILKPGGQVVEKGSLQGPGALFGSAMGALTGGVGGGALGGGAGGAGGGILGALIGAKYGAQGGKMFPTYTGIPKGPLGNVANQLAPRVGGLLGVPIARRKEEAE